MKIKSLTPKETIKYLQNGELTKPFLDDSIIFHKIDCDMKAKTQAGKPCSQISSLMSFIHSKVKYSSGETEFIKNNIFQREAKQIWESGKTVACSDYAILFATFARQLKIPTTFLHTASLQWLTRLKNNESLSKCEGHSFCECFVEGHWILVDPTNKKIVGTYSPSQIVTTYDIGGETKFVPYYRWLDLKIKHTLQSHNEWMKNCCKNI